MWVLEINAIDGSFRKCKRQCRGFSDEVFKFRANIFPRPTLNYFQMTRFRPCIDLHSGQVKQIVGGTLSTVSTDLKTNFVSPLPASYFAQLYRDNGLTGAHVIMLGPGNEHAAQEALSAWPEALQVGGGINESNARQWIDAGAEKVGFCFRYISSIGDLKPCSRSSLRPISFQTPSSQSSDFAVFLLPFIKIREN